MSNNPKTEYKLTDLGEIPEGWEVVRLGEVLKDEGPGVWEDEDKENGTPVLRSTNFKKDGYISYDSVAYRKIPEKVLENKTLKFGNILLERSGGGPDQPVGRVAFFNKKDVIYTFGNFIQRLVPDEEKTNPFFLFKFLHYMHLRGYTRRLQQQTTGIRNLDYRSYLRIKLLLPPLPEQHKIASLLSTVDETIQKTDEVIKKTQKLKKGFMQKLLTKGIGHTRFKQTEIGEIPKGWEVVRLGKIVEKVKQVDPRKDPGKSFKYVDVSSISNEFFKIVGFKEYVGKNAPHRARKPIKEHDVIFATVRPYLKRVAIVPNDFDSEICSTAFTVIRCVSGIVDYRFVFYHLLSERVIGLLTEIQKGSSYPAVSDKDVYNLKFPLPSLPEQRKTAEILSGVDEKIEVERQRKEKLEELKKGLMQDLLTGKVRVKVN